MSATPRIHSISPGVSKLDSGAPLSELATANRQRDALYKLSEGLHRADTPGAIYAAALDAIETALDCDRASVLLFDPDGIMQFVAWHGLSDEYRAAVTGHSPWTCEDADATPIAMPNVAIAQMDASLKANILGEGIHA